MKSAFIPDRFITGADAEKLMKKLAPGVVVSQRRSVVRYLPELSYLPSEAETSSIRN
jgi:hypothetical protein